MSLKWLTKPNRLSFSLFDNVYEAPTMSALQALASTGYSTTGMQHTWPLQYSYLESVERAQTAPQPPNSVVSLLAREVRRAK